MKILLILPIILGLLLNIVLVNPVMADTSNQVQVKRLWGQDRYETAIKIADELATQLKIDFSKGQKFQAVVLASGNNWPDAIAGAPLAKQYNAPILLLDTIPGSECSQKTWDYIQAHVAKSTQIFILGGTGVVPTSFTNYLTTLGFSKNNIEQIGGVDRNETSLLIAKKLENKNNLVYVVSDENFYDALNAASDAANHAAPILLVSPKGIAMSQQTYIKTFPLHQYSVPVITVGELASEMSSFYSDAGVRPNIYSGENRYETNLKFEGRHARDTNLLLSTGLDYPDALAGAVLAGSFYGGGFIVLTDPNTLQPETLIELNDLAYYEHNPIQWPDPSRRFYPTLYVLGGSGAVSDSVLNQVQQVLNSDGYSRD